MSNKELAAHVGLAPSSCLERVRRLRAEGILQGYHARVDATAVGVNLRAMVAVRLATHSGESWATLTDALAEREEVVDVFHVSGKDDLLVHVACRDVEHLRQVVLEAISSHPSVRNVETSLVFAHQGSPLPIYAIED